MGRRKSIGTGYDKSRKNGWYIRVNGAKSYFSSAADRDAAYTKKVTDVEAFGFGGASALTAHDRITMAEMIRQAKAAGTSPLAIFNLGLDRWNETQASAIKLSDAVEQFCADCDSRVKEKTMRAVTAKDLKRISRGFARHVGDFTVRQVANSHVEEFARIGGRSAYTVFNRTARVSILFSWLVRKGMLARNPVVRAKSPKAVPQFYQVELVRKIFKKAEEKYPSLVPIMALQWFAGIRPTATHGLCWEHIDFARRKILIPPELSKSTEPEAVEDVPGTVWTWLRTHQRQSGRLAPPGHVEMYQRLKSDLQITEWPPDVARHSFASHLYAMTDSIDEVARALLHHTTRITLKHYVAFGIKKAAGRLYFATRPAPGRR